MKLLTIVTIIGTLLAAVSCGGAGGGRELSGTFTPDFPPSANNIDRAMSSSMLRFHTGHMVDITDQRGTRTWDYSVRGKQLLLKHADGSTIKDYTLGDGGCLVSRKGDYYLELRYCGGRF